MRTAFLISACAAAVLSSPPAHAALDDVLDANARDVHTIVVAGNALRMRDRGNVKELADADGKVAAATWRGFIDLHTLLGTHYAAYESALRSARFGLHVAHIKTAELELSIVSYGSMRRGSITLTKRLPEGAHVDALH